MNEIITALQYLKPVNGVEYLFFVVISGLALITLILVRFNAKDANWNINVQRELLDNHKDAGEASAVEMADIAATKSEKLAEVLPNVALIIGLFGTFLGIGGALGEASSILPDPNTNFETSAAVDSSINQIFAGLKKVLGGMGAQFKSSIYGVLCYLLFSFAYRALGTTGKRVKFCASLINTRIAEKAENKKTYVNSLFSELASSMKSAFDESVSRQSELLSDHLKTMIDGINKQNDSVQQLQKENKEQSSSLLAQFRALGNSLTSQLEDSFGKQEVALRNSFGDLNNTLGTELKNQKNVLNIVNDTFKEKLDSLKSVYYDGFQNQLSTLQGLFGSQEAVLKTCFNEQKVVLDSQHGTLIGGFADQKTSLINGFEKQTEALKDGFEKQVGLLKELKPSFESGFEGQREALKKGFEDQILLMNEQKSAIVDGFASETITLEKCFEKEEKALHASYDVQHGIFQTAFNDFHNNTKKILAQTEELVKTLSATTDTLSDRVVSSVDLLKNEVVKITDSSVAISNCASNMSDAAINLKDSANQMTPTMKESMGKVESSMTNMLLDIRKSIMETVVDAGNKIAGSGNEIKSAVYSFEQKNTDAQSGLKKSFEELVSKNESCMNEVSSSVKTLVQESIETVEKIGTDNSTSNQGFQEALSSFKSWLDTSLSSVQNNKLLLEQLSQTIDNRFVNIGASNQSISENLQTMNEIFDSKLKIFAESNLSISESLSGVKDSLLKYREQGEQSSTMMRNVLNSYSERSDKSLESIIEAVNTFKTQSEDLNEVSRAFLEKLEEMTKTEG